jgi:hypothetical protein
MMEGKESDNNDDHGFTLTLTANKILKIGLKLVGFKIPHIKRAK